MAVREGLLALLREGPRYGYQLKTEFEAATGGVWTINVGQVYTTLERLGRDGLVTLDERDDQKLYSITLAGVEPPGTHALHIHEIPDCSAPDGMSTGSHWNPPPTMLGELGTVEIADDGTGVFMKTDLWSIGTGETNDVVDHSIIIHAESGGGTRIACGVIAKD